jgi:hypothetical protein
MSLRLVIGPDDPEAARWAAGLQAPDAGRLAFIVPPHLPSFGRFVGEVLGALGKPAAGLPDWGSEAELTEHTLAWLAGHRVERLVLVHADWLDGPLVERLAAFTALAGLDVVCLVQAGRAARRFEPWTAGGTSWVDFVADLTRDETRCQALAADATRHQHDRIGPLGLPAAARRVAAARPAEGDARSAYLDLAGRLRRLGVAHGTTAHALARVLRTFPEGQPFRAALDGAAAALAQAGWELWADERAMAGADAGGGPTWADLRPELHPAAPAAVAVLATGLWPNDAARLSVADVAEDGSWIYAAGAPLEVPAGGRAYLVAQRVLRGMQTDDPQAPFLAHRGRALSEHAIAVSACSALQDAGAVVSVADLLGITTPSGRWLADRGLALRRAPGVTGERIRKQPVCRHGLPATLEVEGVVLSHSQLLCRVTGPEDAVPAQVRSPAAGFEVVEAGREPLGSRHRVTRLGAPAGELVALAIGGGSVWLQVGRGRAPALAAIVAAIAATYPAALDRPRGAPEPHGVDR